MEIVGKDPTVSQPTPKRSKIVRTKLKEVSSCIKDLQDLATSVKSVDSQDEFDIFGQSWSVQLKKLPLQQAIAAQGEIQNLLTRYRLSNVITNSPIPSSSCNSLFSPVSAYSSYNSPSDSNNAPTPEPTYTHEEENHNTSDILYEL
jgi:hypothetical protein